MKKYIFYMCILFACFVALPAAVLAAGTGSAALSVHNNNVDVSLELPEGTAGKITSLRMQLRVSPVSGTMEQPVFTFKDTVKSYVKDASVNKQKDGSYIVDIIISGKSSGEIFGNSNGGGIGTVTVNPTSKSYQIKLEVMSQDKDSNTPGIKYVGSSGLKEEILPLADTNPVTVSSNGGTTAPSDKPDTGTNQPPNVTGTNPVTNINVGRNILNVSCKAGSKKVYFKWQKNEKADGYVLYEYDKKTKQDKIVATITDANKTSYSKSFKNATKYLFRMRPFKTASDGSRIYGDYSPVVSIKVPPAGVKGFSASKTKSKVTLSWKKMSSAKGYKIYKSSKKNGKYSMIKRIKKNSRVKYTDSRVNGGQTYYYKIRAYVKGEQKRIMDGKFSKVLKVRVPR